MKYPLVSIFCLLLWQSVGFAQQSGNPQRSFVTVSGYIRESGSQEALTGVNAYVAPATPGARPLGTTSNTYGFYSLTLPITDSTTLTFSFVGYTTVLRNLSLRSNQTLNVSLLPGKTLSEVVVNSSQRADEEQVSDSPQMSRISIPIEQIKKIPALLGEKDVLKVLQLMPGVQKGSEGNAGIYVRGGGPDQNLLILDDAIVYNANHLFGFFSVFNGDALRSVELTKGGFPARFGGRLSSVIEMNMKEGNKQELHGEGGIGLIASRLTLEGPLTKNKRGSFLISGRRTYLDLVAQPLIKQQTGGQTDLGYYFYDLNAKANYDFGQKDKVYLSGYFGQDRFHTADHVNNTSMGLNWGNATATFRWNHLFSDRLFANTSLIFSKYQFNISSNTQQNGGNQYALDYRSGIRDFSVKYDFDYYPNPQHSLRFGLQSIYHRFTPSAVVLQNDAVGRYNQNVETIDVLESGAYIEDTWRPDDRWRVNAGFRLSHFVQKSVNYIRPEPRLSAAYVLTPSLSLKASYALMNQYVHLLSNTGIGLPTDLWVPTTDRVAPQQSQQVAVGMAKDFADVDAAHHGVTLTVEGYYKRMDNIINYKEGASFLLIQDPTATGSTRWEDNITRGWGWSYGAEVLLQKKAGRFSGWIGYTLSWTKWQFPDLNFGKTFYPRYDRRHDISVVGIYEVNPRITCSATWVYGTGNALTIPTSTYQAYTQPARFLPPGTTTTADQLFQQLFSSSRQVSEYGDKNSFRAEAYNRLDLGVQFHKQKKNHERTWELSVYNAYNRRNPFFYSLDTKVATATMPAQTVLNRYSIFPIVPAITYGFKF